MAVERVRMGVREMMQQRPVALHDEEASPRLLSGIGRQAVVKAPHLDEPGLLSRGRMLQETRQSEIYNLLQLHRTCTIADLAQRFDVSDETIRRDIRQLEAEGQAYRVRGGVTLKETAAEAPYLTRRNQNAEKKQAIALKAAQLVEDGMTILIDSGSTSYWLSRALSKQRHLNIITNALEVAREMAGKNDCRVFFGGGEIDDHYQSCFGTATEAFMSQFTPALAFFSISAIDSRRGLLDIHYPEATLKARLCPLASRVVVLADSTKFERQGIVKALDFKDVDIFITDTAPPAQLLEALRDAEVLIG
ncbi:glycerol-3-phosphate regulon repressor [Asticcacaulis biprosthecium C19]|uniref:Glycerol-3-phosphate regulon repressor n=1 Tax=Asticcacaulis biprosthecium C19 TaxID=715226 RepID=F4QSR9_9CAUL|nr:DeoR/GlpR family DNA-binding transcription regulator [Asticcacaulis biprosthecium]EGF89789.1 glycerol-3-phosphate regulon repressor [Asticcacaulis biprosthecium C19]